MAKSTVLKNVNEEEIERKERVEKRKSDKIRNDKEFVSLIRSSLDDMKVDYRVEGVSENEVISNGVIDVFLNGQKKNIKVFVNYHRRNEISLRDSVEFVEEWLILIGSLSDKNNLGYILKGCDGERVGEYINEIGGNGWRRRIQVEKMKIINLQRRILALG